MKIAILTNFLEFNPGYSLTGIVKDQVEMLAKYGNEVHVYVNEKFHGTDPFDLTKISVFLHKKIPNANLIDYESKEDIYLEEHVQLIAATSRLLLEELREFPVVFTHDFIFTGWFLPYAIAIQQASQEMPDTKWMHWIHSIPSTNRDWWNIRWFGPKHKIIYPNKTDSIRVIEQYKGETTDIRIIPHIKDPRTWFDFSDTTNRIIDAFPQLLNADLVQILPVGADRLDAKRVHIVIQLFSEFKKAGFSVCLFIANQWATTTRNAEEIDSYNYLATSLGLSTIEGEIAWSSQFEPPAFKAGLPKQVVRELFQLSNIFIFPTREESFGLVVPEAILSGGVLPVLNKSLTMQLEISGMNALFFDFGSYHQELNCWDMQKYLHDVAYVIIGRMRENESILAKTFMRQRYNMDNLYNKFYAPIMAESVTWG